MIIKMKKSSILFLICGILVLGSCKENSKIKSIDGNVEDQIETESDSIINEELSVVYWLDQSAAALHSALFKDVNARSDNMKTLLYKKWRLEGANLILTAESIGNGYLL